MSVVHADTSSGNDVPIEERPSSEVTDHLPVVAGVRVRNPAFDVTPADLVTAYITDKGVLPAADGFRGSRP